MPTSPLTFKYKSSTFREGVLFSAEYDLAVEEALEIYIDDAPYAVTMRLPGDDTHLVVGFCFTEGIIQSREDIAAILPCQGQHAGRRIFVHLREDVRRAKAAFRRRTAFFSQSSCGLCGKSSADEIYLDIEPVQRLEQVSLNGILQLKEAFEKRQAIFRLTGTTHSAAIFGIDGQLLAFAEDIGRHNALDKAIGRVVCAGSEKEAFLAIISSRSSFEMVQKAGVLGIQALCGVSGSTGKAVQLADRLNLTLIGFLREKSMTIYTHPERIRTM